MGRTDGALRAMLEELSHKGADEMQGILAALDPVARRHAEFLLSRNTADNLPGGIRGRGLSGWLADRIEQSEQLAPAARAAITVCVADLARHVEAGEAGENEVEPGLRWFSRIPGFRK